MKMLNTTILFVALMFAGLTANAKTFGAWEFHKHKDAITDDNRSFVYVAAAAGDAMFSIGYKHDGMNVMLFLDKYVVGDRDGDAIVIYRIDGGKPSEREYWQLSSDKRVLFVPMHRVSGFVKDLTGKNKIIIRVIDPANGNSLTYTFRINGLKEAYANLLKS